MAKTDHCDRNLPTVHYALLTGILLFSAILLFRNLGDAALWSDEAETAIIAQNFTARGNLSAWDSRNLVCDRNGSMLDRNLNSRNPPLQFILTAASFSVFGRSNFTARLPFAVFGFLTVLLLYLALRREFPNRLPFVLFSTAFLGLFTEYLLYFRNCRYYSLIAFFALLTCFTWRRFVTGPSIKNGLMLTGSAVLLYYSHPLACFAFAIPLAALHITTQCKTIGGQRLLLVMVGVLFAAATVPHVLFNRPWYRPDMPHGLSFGEHVTILFSYVRDSMSSGVAPWSIILASVVLISGRCVEPKLRKTLTTAAILLGGYMVIIGCTARLDAAKIRIDSVPADIRYLAAIFPFTAILAGGVLYSIYRRNRVIACVAAALVIGTNVSYCNPLKRSFTGFHHGLIYSPLYKYIQEIGRHYKTANETAANFLMVHAGRGETFAAYPDYRNGPLLFYIGSRLFGCATLDSTTWIGQARAKSISPYLLKSENFPDWIIFFGLVSYGPEVLSYFSRSLQGKDSNNDYEVAADIALFPDETNRPEIFLHGFGEVQEIEQKDHVVIFHRVKNVPEVWLRSFPQVLAGARNLKDRDALFRVLQKFSDFSGEDSAVANKLYSQETIGSVRQKYGQMLAERGGAGRS